MIIAITLAVALVGLLLFGFASNPKLTTIGLVTYAAGLLAFLLHLPAKAIGFLAQ